MSHWMTSGANRLRRRGVGRNSSVMERSFEREAQARANLKTSKRRKCSSIFRSMNSTCGRNTSEHEEAPSRKRMRNGDHQSFVADEGAKYGERLGLANKRSIKATRLIELPRALYNNHVHAYGYNNLEIGYGRSHEPDMHIQDSYSLPSHNSSKDYQDFVPHNSGTRFDEAGKSVVERRYFDVCGAPDIAYERDNRFHGSEPENTMSTYHSSPGLYSRDEVSVHRILPSKSWREENYPYGGHFEFNNASMDNEQISPFYQYGVRGGEFPSATPFHLPRFRQSEELHRQSDFENEHSRLTEEYFQQSPRGEAPVYDPSSTGYENETGERYFYSYSAGNAKRYDNYTAAEDIASNTSAYFQNDIQTPSEHEAEPTVVNPFDEIHHRVQSSCSQTMHPHPSLNGRFSRYRSPCDRDSKVYAYHDTARAHQSEEQEGFYDESRFNPERSEWNSYRQETTGDIQGIAQFQRSQEKKAKTQQSPCNSNMVDITRRSRSRSGTRNLPFHIPYEGESEGQVVAFFNNGIQVDDYGRPLTSVAVERPIHRGSPPRRSRHSNDTKREARAKSGFLHNADSSPVSTEPPIRTSATKQAISPTLSTKSSQHDVFTFVTGRLPELEAEMNSAVTISLDRTTCDVTNVKNLLRKLYHLSSRQGFLTTRSDLNLNSSLKEKKLPLPMRLANCIRSLESLKHSLEQESGTATAENDDGTVVGSTRKNLFDSFSNTRSKHDAVLALRSTKGEQSKSNASWNLFGQRVEEMASNVANHRGIVNTDEENTSPFDKENKKGTSVSSRDKKYIQMRQRHRQTADAGLQEVDKSPCDSPRSPVSVSIDPPY